MDESQGGPIEPRYRSQRVARRGYRMIPHGPGDPWLLPLALAVLAWDGIARGWRTLVARLLPAALTAEERGLLRERAHRAQSEEQRL